MDFGTVGFTKGGTYTFDQSDSSNSGHPLTTYGTHGGGSEFCYNNRNTRKCWNWLASAPTLYYYCSTGMGQTQHGHGS